MSDFVPPEIIREILIRLPVKSLLRFRSVSKPWRTIIDSKNFTKSHLQNSYETNSNRTLLVKSNELFYVDLESFKQLEMGDNNKFKPHTVACSCDGLALIVGTDIVVLWNPATRQFNKLPSTPPLLSQMKHYLPYNKILIITSKYYGLGYDSKHDDYKVVSVIQSSSIQLVGGFISSETTIYSLRSNSWKRIHATFPYRLPYSRKWGVYLNDALHTLVKVGEGQYYEEVIMAFNIAKEQHYQVPMPSVDWGGGLDLLEVMGGLLTAVVRVEMNASEVWVMKEYGVKESWTKLLTFQPPRKDPSSVLCPLAYSKSGDEVLFNYDGRRLNSYCLSTKIVTVAYVPGLSASFNVSPHDPTFYAEFCVGSLVSPHSPAAGEAGDGGQQGNEGRKIITKKKGDEFLSVGFKLEL